MPDGVPSWLDFLPQAAQPTDYVTGAETASPPYPQLTRRIITAIASFSSGDARVALSLLELVFHSAPTTSESELLESLRRSVSTSYDRTGDPHYDLISALHKSVRGSQPGAALYWLARMLEAGEDPMYIARRMTVCASEDIGIADRGALPMAGVLPSFSCYIAAVLMSWDLMLL